MKIKLITKVLNEKYFINFFIDFYLNLGVDEIHIFDSKSSDETIEIIQEWSKKTNKVFLVHSSVDFRQFSYTHDTKVCNLTYQYAIYLYQKDKEETWFFFPDVDEYIRLGDNTDLKQYLQGKRDNVIRSVFINWYLPPKLTENEISVSEFLSYIKSGKSYGEHLILFNDPFYKDYLFHFDEETIKQFNKMRTISGFHRMIYDNRVIIPNNNDYIVIDHLKGIPKNIFNKRIDEKIDLLSLESTNDDWLLGHYKYSKGQYELKIKTIDSTNTINDVINDPEKIFNFDNIHSIFNSNAMIQNILDIRINFEYWQIAHSFHTLFGFLWLPKTIIRHINKNYNEKNHLFNLTGINQIDIRTSISFIKKTLYSTFHYLIFNEKKFIIQTFNNNSPGDVLNIVSINNWINSNQNIISLKIVDLGYKPNIPYIVYEDIFEDFNLIEETDELINDRQYIEEIGRNLAILHKIRISPYFGLFKKGKIDEYYSTYDEYLLKCLNEVINDLNDILSLDFTNFLRKKFEDELKQFQPEVKNVSPCLSLYNIAFDSFAIKKLEKQNSKLKNIIFLNLDYVRSGINYWDISQVLLKICKLNRTLTQLFLDAYNLEFNSNISYRQVETFFPFVNLYNIKEEILGSENNKNDQLLREIMKRYGYNANPLKIKQ